MQIVHDLKNQLNGLKLYATFLRRRIEKGDRPADEQETITKLIGGLDRAAEDLAMIVRYGRPLELKKQPGIEVDKVLRSACTPHETIVWKSNSNGVQGSFDHFQLADAFKWLCSGAIKHRQPDDGTEITVTTKLDGNNSTVIEWAGLRPLDHDPFQSFAGIDDIKLAMAAKIIEAHGGSAKFIDKKFVVELPLT
jgi:light-regulated signal transduction histidine kinase (bacteriophytochrome)